MYKGGFKDNYKDGQFTFTNFKSNISYKGVFSNGIEINNNKNF